MNCNTLLSQNLGATKTVQAANIHFYSHFLILSFYSTPDLQQVLSHWQPVCQHSFSSVMNYLPWGSDYGQRNFRRVLPQDGVCPQAGALWGSHATWSSRTPPAQNCTHTHQVQHLMNPFSSASEKLNLLVMNSIFQHHQINHYYRRIPFHSNVAAEIIRDKINILEADRAQDISGQIMNQMSFNISGTMLTTSEHKC